MSTVSSAKYSAQRAGNSKPLEMLTRGGFIGYGIFHLAVAWLALQLALGHPAGESDQSGAFQVLVRQPLGKTLVWLIIVGMIAMTIWQLFEATIGHRAETGKHRTRERLISAGRVLIYGFLVWTAIKTVTGAGTSSAGQQKQTTAGLLSSGGGRFLVILAGLAVLGIGIGMIGYGAKRKFERRLNYGGDPRIRRTAVRLGQLGYIGKGVAIGLVGVLLVSAAASRNAAKSTGLDGALRTLAAHPYGVLVLILIAAGFAAYGVYCFFQSKYRKV